MRILLTVCGSISAYKSYDLVRSLVNEGHEVKVIVTRGATEFIREQTFRYLGAKDVYRHDDDFQFPKLPEHNNVLHIELARWCQKFVIAPASANTLANLSMGKASDLTSSVFLALEDYKPVIIFPAMNSHMLEHTLVQENMSVLQRLKKVDQVRIMPTKTGELACGEVGSGKLLDIDHMVDLIDCTPMGNLKVKSQNILITTGATLSPLDSVRYLTNPSSGLTGHVIAKYALSRGHKVTVLAGKYATKQLDNLTGSQNYNLVRVTTTTQMQSEVLNHIEASDCYLSAAAIGDIEFEISQQKIKKSQMGDSLKIKKSPDILKQVTQKYSDKFIIGFAAETNLSEEILKQKYESKPVDILVGTLVSNGLATSESQGFQGQCANYNILKDGHFETHDQWDKKSLAQYLIEQMEQNNAH